jgi:hypothetical protein
MYKSLFYRITISPFYFFTAWIFAQKTLCSEHLRLVSIYKSHFQTTSVVNKFRQIYRIKPTSFISQIAFLFLITHVRTNIGRFAITT